MMLRNVEPRPLLTGFAALALLNVALSFRNLWPTPAVVPALAVSVEAFALLLALAAAAALGRAPRQRLRAIIAVALTALVLGRYADVTAAALFGRPISLYWDAPHLPQLALLAGESIGWPAFALVLSLAAALICAVYRLLRAALAALVAALAAARPRRALVLAGVAAIALGTLAERRGFADDAIAEPVTVGYARQLALAASALAGRTDAALPPGPRFETNLAPLSNADVLLIFVESYGATTYDDDVQR
ncbi:MAG TPA: hypothetical protein VM491_05895, partial [Burkholderiaceae bacterium]|nr:hypothetical protein [Burkholderiaceae bacterium]